MGGASHFSSKDDLASDDAFLACLLLDQLGFPPPKKLGVHYVDPDFKPPAYDARKLLYIVQEYVCKRGQPAKALLHLLSQPAFVKYIRDANMDEQRSRAFKKHAMLYLNLLLPNSQLELGTTPRYSEVTKKTELACYATSDIPEFVNLGQWIAGSLVFLNPKEEAEISGRDSDLRHAPVAQLSGSQETSSGGAVFSGGRAMKDFSVINFKKGKLGFKSALFLGPARFLNHDCQSNCELRKISKQVIISTKRLIKKGEDLTVHYGDNYFGVGNHECLCLSCETKGMGYFAMRRAAERERNAQREDTRSTTPAGSEEELVMEPEAEVPQADSSTSPPSVSDVHPPEEEELEGSANEEEYTSARPRRTGRLPTGHGHRQALSSYGRRPIANFKSFVDNLPKCSVCRGFLGSPTGKENSNRLPCPRCTRHNNLFDAKWPNRPKQPRPARRADAGPDVGPLTDEEREAEDRIARPAPRLSLVETVRLNTSKSARSTPASDAILDESDNEVDPELPVSVDLNEDPIPGHPPKSPYPKIDHNARVPREQPEVNLVPATTITRIFFVCLRRRWVNCQVQIKAADGSTVTVLRDIASGWINISSIFRLSMLTRAQISRAIAKIPIMDKWYYGTEGLGTWEGLWTKGWRARNIAKSYGVAHLFPPAFFNSKKVLLEFIGDAPMVRVDDLGVPLNESEPDVDELAAEDKGGIMADDELGPEAGLVSQENYSMEVDEMEIDDSNDSGSSSDEKPSKSDEDEDDVPLSQLPEVKAFVPSVSTQRSERGRIQSPSESASPPPPHRKKHRTILRVRSDSDASLPSRQESFPSPPVRNVPIPFAQPDPNLVRKPKQVVKNFRPINRPRGETSRGPSKARKLENSSLLVEVDKLKPKRPSTQINFRKIVKPEPSLASTSIGLADPIDPSLAPIRPAIPTKVEGSSSGLSIQFIPHGRQFGTQDEPIDLVSSDDDDDGRRPAVRPTLDKGKERAISPRRPSPRPPAPTTSNRLPFPPTQSGGKTRFLHGSEAAAHHILDLSSDGKSDDSDNDIELVRIFSPAGPTGGPMVTLDDSSDDGAGGKVKVKQKRRPSGIGGSAVGAGGGGGGGVPLRPPNRLSQGTWDEPIVID